MKDAVIFKTGATIESPTIGLDKMIVNFPGGVSYEIPSGNTTKGLFLKRESADIVFKLKVYNGHLMSKSNVYEFIDNKYLKDTVTDSFGNVVRYYEITDYDPTYPTAEYNFHLTLSTTRVEVLEISNYSTCWYGGNSAGNKINEGEVNIEGFALSLFPAILVKNCPAYGNIRVFKNCSHINYFFVNSTNVEGDIANFALCAAQPGSFGHQKFQCYNCPNIYGKLESLLDAMKERTDIRGQSFTWYLGSTQITYQNNTVPTGGSTNITFDTQGNYTVTFGG